MWAIHATLSEKSAVIAALLRGQPDPRFVTQTVPRVSLRPSPIRVRYAMPQAKHQRAAA
jgi:hypothetical protein